MKRKKRVSGEVLRMSSLLREYLVFLFAASSLWSLTSIPYVVWASVHAGHPAELCDVGHVPSLRRPQLWHWALQGPAGKMAIAAMEIFFTCPLFLFFFIFFLTTLYATKVLTQLTVTRAMMTTRVFAHSRYTRHPVTLPRTTPDLPPTTRTSPFLPLGNLNTVFSK